jgi:hypothetical protein
VTETEAAQAHVAALRANLALSPAERIAELVELNRLHADIQSRTLDARRRRALLEVEVRVARARLLAEQGREPGE